MWDIRQARRGEFITAEAPNIYSVFHLKYLDHGCIVDDARIDLLSGAYEFNSHNEFADLTDPLCSERIRYRQATVGEADLLKDAGRRAAFLYTDEYGFGTLRSDLGPNPYIVGIMDDRLSLLLDAGLVDWTTPDK